MERTFSPNYVLSHHEGYGPIALPSQEPQLYSIIRPPQEILKFQNDTERQLFQQFKTQYAPEISGAFIIPFWNSLVLQACHDELFIRDLVIALSAFSTSTRIFRTEGNNSAARAADHNYLAFKRYQRGLQGLRAKTNKPQFCRAWMIGCLLVCSIEGVLGNIVSVRAHIKSAQSMIEYWLSSQPPKRGYKEGLTSPASHIVEDELIQALSFFDHQLMKFVDPRPLETHMLMKKYGEDTVREMPDNFESIDEARLYQILIIRRIDHFGMFQYVILTMILIL